MTDQFIRKPPRRPELCGLGIALALLAGLLSGFLSAYYLRGNALFLAEEIARAESLRVADLQTEVDKATAALIAEQRKSWGLQVELDAVRQPLADIAELTAAVRKLTLPTLSPRKIKTVPSVKPTAPRAVPPILRMIAPPKPKPAPAPAIKSWPEQMTAAHNAVRASVGVPPLAWDSELAQEAAKWVMHLAQTGCNFVHSGGPDGENLFRSSVTPTAADIVNAWAAERDHYDYTSNTCAAGKVCGHYTQLVWKSTKSVGCALAVCQGGKGYISVCEYDPAGNWAGERPF